MAKLPRPSLRTSRKCLCLQQAGRGHGKFGKKNQPKLRKPSSQAGHKAALNRPLDQTAATQPDLHVRQLHSHHQGTSTTDKPHMESTAQRSQQGPTHSSSSVSASCIRSLWLCLNRPLNFMAAHARLDKLLHTRLGGPQQGAGHRAAAAAAGRALRQAGGGRAAGVVIQGAGAEAAGRFQ